MRRGGFCANLYNSKFEQAELAAVENKIHKTTLFSLQALERPE